MPESASRQRGKHHDPVGTVLGALWALGHAAVIGLLGIAVHNQADPGHLGAERAASYVPDSEPLA
ncbi:hypothetical protein PUR61_44970 [Streptomyces sp. BE20]|uniref:hypothetical protein n=1 Tax=Streptomyces sp. BE20 TaxID=3002525 RepID=UPI002E79898D|nr:hypothetical protein [Streptomyces sp. BE20]MEE1829270.1 hypothetical protein [Streptomyces sp. BE20]